MWLAAGKESSGGISPDEISLDVIRGREQEILGQLGGGCQAPGLEKAVQSGLHCYYRFGSSEVILCKSLIIDMLSCT